MNILIIIILIVIILITIYIQSIFKINIEQFNENILTIDELRDIIKIQYPENVNKKYDFDNDKLELAGRSYSVLAGNGFNMGSFNYLYDVLKNGYKPYDNEQLNKLNTNSNKNSNDDNDYLYIQYNDIIDRLVIT